MALARFHPVCPERSRQIFRRMLARVTGHHYYALGRLLLAFTIFWAYAAFWVRKDAPMRTIADLKGKKVTMGYSAMRTIDVLTRANREVVGRTAEEVLA